MWHRPSAAGRRLSLDRWWRLNVAHYGGRVKLLTLTAPGEDVLPWGDETRPFGKLPEVEHYPQVEWIYREVWNVTAQARASRLMEAAQKAADRWARRQGYKGVLPRQIGNVRPLQKRGVWHFHYLLPFETELERSWSRLVHRYLDNAWKRDLERWPDPEERLAILFAEYAHGTITRGFYGFGFVNARNPAGRSADRSARYAARNAAGYVAANAAGRNRAYVSTRLTRETGVTMKALRSVNWLYVRRKQIASGELLDTPVPGHWSEAWAARVLLVESLVSPRGP